MHTRKRQICTHIRQSIGLCFLLFLMLVLTGCGVYSKAAPVNPEETLLWSGPLLDEADMENVRIFIQPNQHTITLNMEDIDGDLRILLAEYDTNT